MNYLARFQIVQDRHVPGVAGEIVAEGVRFSAGYVAVHWLRNSFVRMYSDMPQLYHNHTNFDPSTMAVHWIDPPPPGPPTINDVGE